MALEYVLLFYFILLLFFISLLFFIPSYTWMNRLIIAIAYSQLLFHCGKTLSKLASLDTDSEKLSYLTQKIRPLIFSNTSVNLLTILVLLSLILRLLNYKLVPRTWTHIILSIQLVIFLVQVPGIAQVRVLYYVLEFFLVTCTAQAYKSSTFVYLSYAILSLSILLGFFFLPSLEFDDFFESFILKPMYEGLTILSAIAVMYASEEIFESMKAQGFCRNLENFTVFVKGKVLYNASKRRIYHCLLFFILGILPFAQYYFIQWAIGHVPLLLKLAFARNLSIPLACLLAFSNDKTIRTSNMLTGLDGFYRACLINRIPVFMSLAFIIVLI